MSATKSTSTVSVLAEAPVSRVARPGPSICETCEGHAARLVPAESSARNTIETVFCLPRNHISGFGFERYFSIDDKWATGACRAGRNNFWGPKKEAAMKRCAQCHGKLGLGVRSRNLWNGRWWIHVRYCSARCEARHELERRERQNIAGTHLPISQFRRAE